MAEIHPSERDNSGGALQGRRRMRRKEAVCFGSQQDG